MTIEIPRGRLCHPMIMPVRSFSDMQKLFPGEDVILMTGMAIENSRYSREYLKGAGLDKVVPALLIIGPSPTSSSASDQFNYTFAFKGKCPNVLNDVINVARVSTYKSESVRFDGDGNQTFVRVSPFEVELQSCWLVDGTSNVWWHNDSSPYAQKFCLGPLLASKGLV